MSLDPVTLSAILLMAAVTYFTRIAGLWLDRFLRHERARSVLEAVPGAVLVAVIAPQVLAQGPAGFVAGAITALAASRLPMGAVVVVGVVAAALLRRTLA